MLRLKASVVPLLQQAFVITVDAVFHHPLPATLSTNDKFKYAMCNVILESI
jgi:hypothetical protein